MLNDTCLLIRQIKNRQSQKISDSPNFNPSKYTRYTVSPPTKKPHMMTALPPMIFSLLYIIIFNSNKNILITHRLCVTPIGRGVAKSQSKSLTCSLLLRALPSYHQTFPSLISYCLCNLSPYVRNDSSSMHEQIYMPCLSHRWH